jgi:hypothetical protein
MLSFDKQGAESLQTLKTSCGRHFSVTKQPKADALYSELFSKVGSVSSKVLQNWAL